MNSGSDQTNFRETRRIAIAIKRALVAHANVETLRLIRETLTDFTFTDVDTSPDAAYAFELSLRQPYDLIIIDLDMPVIHGELLYELIAKAYPFCHVAADIGPPVIFIAEKNSHHDLEILKRDARVKGIITRPFSIEKIISSVESILKRRIEPKQKGN